MNDTHVAAASDVLNEDAYRPGYAEAAERILRFIAASNLQPGDRLPTESALGAEIGFSRSITREAIKVLSAIGRVEAHRGRGLFVAASASGLLGEDVVQRFRPTNLSDITAMFEFRRTQEAELARLAAVRAAPADVVAIEEASRRLREAIDHGDFARFPDLDLAFHESVAHAARNALLSAARRSAVELQRQTAEFGARFGEASLRNAADEHDAIVAAIRSGDGELAVEAAKAHLDRTYYDYHAHIQRELLRRTDASEHRAQSQPES